MSSETGTTRTRNRCHSINLCRPREFSFPIDYYREFPIDQLPAGARTAYLVDTGDPESVRCLGHGTHQVNGGRQVIALESDDRFFIAPVNDCILEYSADEVRLVEPESCAGSVTIGVKKMSRQAIITGADVDSLFSAISFICTMPGETSPYRSHPLFRDLPPDIRLSSDGSCLPHTSCGSPIRFQLPPDLKYLYAVTPLSYYLGASVETGDGPHLEINGKPIGLPSEYRHFERWAGKMLSHTFQADCAVRCQIATGDRLPGIDVQALTGYSPEELMLMTMPDRFLLYSETLRYSRRAFNTWHMASYIEPVPSSIEILPFLMRSLSAIYAPKSTRLSEREVVSLSVSNFKGQHNGLTRGDPGPANAVVLPSLYNAQTQQWYSDGCPVDASLSSVVALKNSRNYARDRLIPEVCVICNEQPMAGEAYLLKKLLGRIANVEIRTDLSCNDLTHTFSEGFDIVHYAGHCDRRGLKCRDGHADLSSVGTCNVPVFFLNSCSSYVHGTRLIEKGAVCGIATMFRLLDEAALDVCTGFYRMLSQGYSIMTAYLGARECSVTGKEYLLIGDGFYKIFNGRDSFLPFYKLSRNSFGFTIQCKMPGRDKGLLVRAGNGRVMADTGFEMMGINAEDLQDLEGGLDGMCLYGASIYNCLGDAVEAALIDLKRSVSVSRTKGDGTLSLWE
jgi:hypothetical protein